MDVIYTHNHLKPGSVTPPLICGQAKALQNDCGRELLLVGEAFRHDFPPHPVAIEGLGYNDINTAAMPPPSTVANAVLGTIKNHFDGACGLLHVRNPLLFQKYKFSKHNKAHL